MRTYWTLTRRELGGFFFSITGYVIIAAVAFLLGLSFVVIVVRLGGDTTIMPVTELFYMTPFFWLILLLAAPVITMRLFAQEKFSGTFETLMTTPVGDLQVVAAKFTAALVFYLVTWLPLLGCIAALRYYASDPTALDPGSLGSTFIGIGLLGCVFIGLGCFASALTRSQMAASMIGLTLGVGLFLLSFLAERLPAGNWTAQVLSLFALPDQMHDFSRGIVDTRFVLFYLSLAFLFLFLTLRVVESRRWK